LASSAVPAKAPSAKNKRDVRASCSRVHRKTPSRGAGARSRGLHSLSSMRRKLRLCVAGRAFVSMADEKRRTATGRYVDGADETVESAREELEAIERGPNTCATLPAHVSAWPGRGRIRGADAESGRNFVNQCRIVVAAAGLVDPPRYWPHAEAILGGWPEEFRPGRSFPAKRRYPTCRARPACGYGSFP
jgi:hypothetical protein